jgi:hypothetical protein
METPISLYTESRKERGRSPHPLPSQSRLAALGSSLESESAKPGRNEREDISPFKTLEVLHSKRNWKEARDKPFSISRHSWKRKWRVKGLLSFSQLKEPSVLPTTPMEGKEPNHTSPYTHTHRNLPSRLTHPCEKRASPPRPQQLPGLRQPEGTPASRRWESGSSRVPQT